MELLRVIPNESEEWRNCVGCKYDDFEVWAKADKDYCQMCKSPGTERKPKSNLMKG